MHKDYLTYSALKVFVKEKEFYIQQGLHAHAPGLLVGHYLKMLDLTMQLLTPQTPHKMEYPHEKTVITVSKKTS